MGLTDKQILELDQLCGAVIDGTISEPQQVKLSDWLRTSGAAREFYVRSLGLSASLHGYAGEMQSEPPSAPAVSRASRGLADFARQRWQVYAAAAAAVAAAVAVTSALWTGGVRGGGGGGGGHPVTPGPGPASVIADEQFVAQLTGSKDCKWVGQAATPGAQRGDHRLRKGQRLELSQGLAEVTFDCGAQVVLEGPALIELTSAWNARLLRGTLKAAVPPQAIGFEVGGPAVDVVDLGTEFTMIADDGSGATDVLVLKGAVEADPQNAGDRQSILLHERESRRFAEAGVSDVHDSAMKFARFAPAVSLTRFEPPTPWVHWSFDESEGRVARAERNGTADPEFDAKLEFASGDDVRAAHVSGRWGRGIQFNGHVFGVAPYPGISGNTPRTVAFWARVPRDAPLTNSYAMVAWRAEGKTLGAKSVHIGWNRNRVEGNIGILRTDYLGGYALGETPLRDGRWHHIAVVYVPGSDPDAPMQVKQYVDGRFEGDGHPSPVGSKTGPTSAGGADEPAPAVDSVWMGCRLGISGPRKERFVGALDELFVIDRALGPQEILHLMNDNRLPKPDAVAIHRSAEAGS